MSEHPVRRLNTPARRALSLPRARRDPGPHSPAGTSSQPSRRARVAGAALKLALTLVVGDARDAWLRGLDPIVISETSTAGGDIVIDPLARVVQSGWGWRTPDGIQLSFDEGLARVPREIFEYDDPLQYPDSSAWLDSHGYASLALGVTDELAMGWAPYDGLAFSLIGAASLAGTIVVVNRRRPT